MATLAERGARTELPPIVTAVLVHAVCWTLLGGIAWTLDPEQSAAVHWPAAEGALAAALGCALRMPLWWVPINAAFFPALIVALGASIAPGWLLAGFVVLYCLQTGAWRQRVPLLASSAQAARRVAGLLPHRRGLRVIDLGCGTASFLRSLAASRPDASCHGVEVAPLPFLLARWRAWRQGGAYTVRWGDFWLADLARYDVVYAYLSPAPMERLWAKARREMRPGTLLVSNGFAVPGAQPLCTFDTGGHLSPVLHVYRM